MNWTLGIMVMLGGEELRNLASLIYNNYAGDDGTRGL